MGPRCPCKVCSRGFRFSPLSFLRHQVDIKATSPGLVDATLELIGCHPGRR